MKYLILFIAFNAYCFESVEDCLEKSNYDKEIMLPFCENVVLDGMRINDAFAAAIENTVTDQDEVEAEEVFPTEE